MTKAEQNIQNILDNEMSRSWNRDTQEVDAAINRFLSDRMADIALAGVDIEL